MNKFSYGLVNFIIRIYSQSDTICSFVEPFLTTYSTESSDCGNYEIHMVTSFNSALGRWRVMRRYRGVLDV